MRIPPSLEQSGLSRPNHGEIDSEEVLVSSPKVNVVVQEKEHSKLSEGDAVLPFQDEAPSSEMNAFDRVFETFHNYVCNGGRELPAIEDSLDKIEISSGMYDQRSPGIDETSEQDEPALNLYIDDQEETRDTEADRADAIEGDGPVAQESTKFSPTAESALFSNANSWEVPPPVEQHTPFLNEDKKGTEVSAPATQEKLHFSSHQLVLPTPSLPANTEAKRMAPVPSKGNTLPSETTQKILPSMLKGNAISNADTPMAQPELPKSRSFKETEATMNVLPNQVICEITKASQEEKTGLSFVSYVEKEGVFVSKIRPESKFQGTGLVPGMRIVSINSQPCPDRVKEVIQMVQAAESYLKIVAVDAKAEKPPNAKQGKKEEKSRSTPKTSKIEKSPRSDDLHCASDGNRQDSAGHWTSLGDTNPFYKSFDCTQNNTTDEDDERDANNQDRLVLFGKKSKASEVAETNVALAPTPLHEKTSEKAFDQSLKKEDLPSWKQLEFEPEEEPYRASYSSKRIVHAKVLKRTPKEKLGISFVSFKTKPGIYIYEIFDDSLFQDTMLEPGMEVLFINGSRCPNRVSETLAIVKAIQGDLIISAQTYL